MHTFSSTMPVISHIEPPYAFDGLSLEQLPQAARELVTSNLLFAENYDPRHIRSLHDLAARKLNRSLLGVFNTLVAHRREVAGITATKKGYQNEKERQAAALIAERVFLELLPEVHDHVHRFTLETDTLVWFEASVCEGTPDGLSSEGLAEYRQLILDNVVGEAFKSLYRLDASVVERDLETLRLGSKTNVKQVMRQVSSL